MPVAWKLRARPDNEDCNWLFTRILRGRESWPIRISRLPEMPKARVLSTARVDLRSGGAKPVRQEKKYTLETGAESALGLKIDAIGLDTSLKVTAEASMSIALEATLPSKHSWEVAWLAGPLGARVITI